MKKITVFLLFLFSIGTYADIPERPDPPRLVNDYIGLLSSAERESLEQKLVIFEQQTSIQIAVVIVNNVTVEIHDDAVAIGNKWAVGQEEFDNGIVFLVAKEDRKMAIATGYGSGGYITESIAKRIIEQDIKPHFKAGDYTAGIIAGVDRMITFLGTTPIADRKALEKQQREEEAAETQESLETFGMWATIIAILCGFIFLIVRTYRKSSRVKKQVREMKKYYQNIIADEIVLQPNWPQWAKDEFALQESRYRSLARMCGGWVKNLPSFGVTRIFAKENELKAIKDELVKFDEVDQIVTKIRNDVKFYRENAEKGIIDAMKIAENLRTLIEFEKNAYSYNLTEDRKKINLIDIELANLKITDAGSYKVVYLKAFDLAKKTIEMKKEIEHEIQAHATVAEMLDKDKSYQSEFEKLIVRSGHSWRTIKLYPRTAQKDLVTFEKLEDYKKYVSDKFKSANQIVVTGKERVYTKALAELMKATTYIEKIETAVKQIDDRLHDLKIKKETYFKTKESADKAIADAEKKVKDTDVKKSTHEMLDKVKEGMQEVRIMANREPADWITIHSTLVELKTEADAVVTQAKKDIKKAQSSYSSNNDSDWNTFNTVNTANVVSSINIGGDSGSSFSGFGGGSFDGGGASGSW
jgi:uncharacterized membrane protein YgcG